MKDHNQKSKSGSEKFGKLEDSFDDQNVGKSANKHSESAEHKGFGKADKERKEEQDEVAENHTHSGSHKHQKDADVSSEDASTGSSDDDKQQSEVKLDAPASPAEVLEDGSLSGGFAPPAEPSTHASQDKPNPLVNDET